MKTTIDIPEPLYRKAKIRAVESGLTLRELVVAALERDLGELPVLEPAGSYWTRRKLRPGYAAAIEAGAFAGGTDSTKLVSDDRTSRDETVL